VPADDWEIDPRHVSLGVEIGQGAFGRVLTGFYRHQQVAIKVLKGTTYRSSIDELAVVNIGQALTIYHSLGLSPQT